MAALSGCKNAMCRLSDVHVNLHTPQRAGSVIRRQILPLPTPLFKGAGMKKAGQMPGLLG